MHEEYFSIDKSSPVVYTFKLEACLYGTIFHLAQTIVHISAVQVHCLEEVVAYIKAEDSILGVSVCYLLTIYAAVLLMVVYCLWQQVVTTIISCFSNW